MPFRIRRCHSSRHTMLLVVILAAVALLRTRKEPIFCGGEGHELGSENVAVRQSRIPGAGLGAFALRSFNQGERIGRYACSMHQKGSDATYVWALNSTHGCDAKMNRLHNPLRYVNSIAALESCSRQNVGMHLTHQHAPDESPVVYVATRRIEQGEELLVDYGAAYFRNRHTIVYECDMAPVHLACSRPALDTAYGFLGSMMTSTWPCRNMMLELMPVRGQHVQRLES